MLWFSVCDRFCFCLLLWGSFGFVLDFFLSLIDSCVWMGINECNIVG